MPWQERLAVDQRRAFLEAVDVPGANFAALCREHGISRKTGYKWKDRYWAEGEAGLEERSRRPRKLQGLDGEVVLQFIELRQAHRWGPKKLKRLFENRWPEKTAPSIKTIARILERCGEPKLRHFKRRLLPSRRPRLAIVADGPNDVWTVDFKGWWRTRDGKRVEPLTVRDAFSRYIIAIELLGSTKAADVRDAFERLFKSHGMPREIRVDNGAPFGCTSSPAGLTRLSAWWTYLGVKVVFGRPAHPEDNGAHERMHRDVAEFLERNPAATPKAQQRAAERLRVEFNEVRPHEALGMEVPAKLYRRSKIRYRPVRSFAYPAGYELRRIRSDGHLNYGRRKIFISQSLAGHNVGVQRTPQGLLKLRFCDLELGAWDPRTGADAHPERLPEGDLLRRRPKRKAG